MLFIVALINKIRMFIRSLARHKQMKQRKPEK